MSATEIEGEIVGEETHYLPAVREDSSATLFNTTDPAAVIEKAAAAAEPLATVVRKQGLAVSIQGREHVKVEGWTLLGSMLGVFPVCIWSKKIMRDGKEHGWEARVEARTRNGDVVGAAEAQCTRDENQWSFTPTGRNGQTQQPRDDYALRSMAQTRATSKALRQPLGFVMQLAGFEATPAEEVPEGGFGDPHGIQSARADAPVADATDKQRAMIERLAQKLGVDPGPVETYSKRDASARIEELLAMESGAGAGGNSDDIPFQRTFA